MIVPETWRALLEAATSDPSWDALCCFVREERARRRVFPCEEDVFAALARTPPERVAVVIVGQDPYHGEGQAHGLAFSVRRGVPKPPSLVNIHKELHADVGCAIPSHGCLEAWADRGVLLLNTVLTVGEGEAASHAGRGWERFTDALLAALAARATPAVFVLWGTQAQKKKRLVDRAPHRVIEGVHPSPLSAHRGFFGSRPFSAINRALAELGRTPIDWSIPD